MVCVRSLVCLLLTLPICGQTLSTHIYGGSGNDAINEVAVDPSGNIYVAGTTTSFDLPLLHPSQAANSGTQIVYSPDSGITWKPLANLPAPLYGNGQPVQLAVDPTNPAVVYAGYGAQVFKSTDAGQHFSAGVVLPGAGYGYVSSLAIDPTQPALIYATTMDGGTVYRSIDAGATWTQVSGLPATGNYDTVVLDPFHPKSLWVWAAVGGFISTDGGNTWNDLPLTFDGGSISGGIRFLFDATTPGTVYGPGLQNGQFGLQKSTDGGKTWTPLMTPFSNPYAVADPVRAGYLYALDNSIFYRTEDGGATWQSFPFPAGQFAPSPAVDPANPNIIVAGMDRSTDDGQTWSPTAVSRPIAAAFAPSGKGLVYATAPSSSDVFLAKFAPDGRTLLFATYFGGMGNDSASGVQIDGSGNVWVAGTTSSVDLPVSSNALQGSLKGSMNGFLVKFSSTGQYLASTYLGGSAADTIKSFKVDNGGNVWLTGLATSPDFPVTTGPCAACLSGVNNFVFLTEVDPGASKLLYSTQATTTGAEQPGGLSIDPSGNILITGTTTSAKFPVSPNVIHAPPANGMYTPNAFLIKFDNSGNTLFSTYLGGTQPSTDQGQTYLENYGVAVAADASGIYLTGGTSALDFPTTAGAFQTTLHGGCPYPSSAYITGFIGTIFFYGVDDVFVTKLSPDGTKLIYSTLLGGSCYDRPTDLVVTPTGSVYVTGETDSLDFPVVHPLENGPTAGQYESFVSMLNAGGSSLPFSTYLLAGSGPMLALGPDGVLHVGGSAGLLAQTQTETGGPLLFEAPDTDGFLAAIDVSAAPAALNLTAALNAFSLYAGSLAAGEIVQLTVPGFHPAPPVDIGLDERLPLLTTLSGVQVLFDGQPVPIVRVTAGKIVCLAPQDFGTQQTTNIQVSGQGMLSNVLTVTIAPSAVGLLSADGSGQGLANARNADGTLNSPRNPAAVGSTVTLYVTGTGLPPQPVMVNFGQAGSLYPLTGFVPGIYALDYPIPSDAYTGAFYSVLADTGNSQSQTLNIYIK